MFLTDYNGTQHEAPKALADVAEALKFDQQVFARVLALGVMKLWGEALIATKRKELAAHGKKLCKAKWPTDEAVHAGQVPIEFERTMRVEPVIDWLPDEFKAGTGLLADLYHAAYNHDRMLRFALIETSGQADSHFNLQALVEQGCLATRDLPMCREYPKVLTAAFKEAGGNPKLLEVTHLYRRVEDSIRTDKNLLHMETWHERSLEPLEVQHSCDTPHCIAGWAIAYAGVAGRALELAVGPSIAGTLILSASAPGIELPSFAMKDPAAMDFIVAAAARS